MYHIQPFYIGGNRYDIPILYVQFLRRNIQTCFRNIRNRNIFPFFLYFNHLGYHGRIIFQPMIIVRVCGHKIQIQDL